MDLARASFVFTDGRKIEVSESTWETSSVRSMIEEQAKRDRARLNGSGDSVFLYFLEAFYSYLASVSSGEVPGPEEAFALPDEDLDSWFLQVVKVNPEGFVKIDRDLTGEVTFRDGSKYTIISSYLPSVTIRRARLETEALKKEPDPEHPRDVFAVYLYPVLASCTIGETPLPPPDEIRSGWPEMEVYKWRDAVEAINPHLFGSNERKTVEQEKELTKKKEKPRRRLSLGSDRSFGIQETTSRAK